MADHSWPASLPDFLVDGYQGGGGDDGVLRSRVGRGSKIRAQWTTPPPEPVSANILCTRTQLQTLRDFYNVTLRRTLAFNHIDLTRPDEPVVEYRFVGRPAWGPNRAGTMWRVSLQLQEISQYQDELPVTQTYERYPLEPGSYGPAKYFTNSSILVATNVTQDAALDQFTIGVTTGNFILSGSATMPVVVGDVMAFWFEAVSGTPTTAQVRFVTSAGANIGAAENLTLDSGYYKLTTTVPATAAYVNFFVTNTGGSPVVISRPAMAVAGAQVLDNTQDHGELWQTISAGKVSGSGTAATLNVDGTVTCPSGAVQFARCDMNVSDGNTHVWQVKLDSEDVKYVLVRYQGTGTGLVRLENWGGGWWGKVTTVPTGTGPTFYARVEVDNNTSTLYTAGTVTIEEIHCHVGTAYSRFFPVSTAASLYDKSEIVVQQIADGINVYMPGSNAATNKYIRWQLRYFTGAVGSGTGWTIERLHEVTRTGDDAFMPGYDLTDSGEHLLAVREASGPHMGGDTHGYQIGSSAILTVDGLVKTIDDATSYRCTSASLATVSQMVNGTPRFDVDTSILFDGDGVTTSHVVEALDDTELVSCYSMLSPHRYLNGTSANGTIFSTVAWAPAYTPTSTAVAGDVITNAERFTLSGDKGISADVEVIVGWDPLVSESYVQRASSSVKLYFSPPGIYPNAGPGFALNAGNTLEWTTLYKVDTAN